MQHIRACLPELRTRVNSLLSKNQQILTSLGGPVENKVRKNRQWTWSACLPYVRALHCFKWSFHFLLHTHKPLMAHRTTLKLLKCNTFCDCYIRKYSCFVLVCFFRAGGARICYIFHQTFSLALENIKPLHGLTHSDILHAITNATVMSIFCYKYNIPLLFYVGTQISSVCPRDGIWTVGKKANLFTPTAQFTMCWTGVWGDAENHAIYFSTCEYSCGYWTDSIISPL